MAKKFQRSQAYRAKQSFARTFAAEQGLRPLPEVQRLWNERSGESISRARVWQILQKAEAKVAAAMTNEWPQQDSNL